MGRQPCCDKVGLKKGPWTAEEDKKLINFILNNGQCCWRAVPKLAGLLRCGKSCRLRWTNYLRPDLKRGLLSDYEENMVIDLHSQLGNRWSKIASHFPGRTDNEIKNHWNTHIKKKLKKMGIDPVTHEPLPPPTDHSQEPLKQSTEEMQHQNREIETSLDTNIINDDQAKGEENKDMETPFEPFSSIQVINNGFCIDDVPLVQPHEILVPSSSAPPPSPSSNSTSASGSFINSVLDDLKFLPTFDWLDDDDDDATITTTNNNMNMGFWNDDAFSSLDLFINDFGNDRNHDVTVQPPNLTQDSRMVLDEESWKYELF